MEQQDIRQSILWQLDDINDVEKLCQVDQLFKNLCSRKEFWMHWYNIKNIKLINSFNTPEEWINEYRYIENIKQETVELMNYLNSPEERILVFTYKADLSNYHYLLLNNDFDINLYQFLQLYEGDEIQCEITKDHIYHVPSVITAGSIEEYKVTLSELYSFLFNVLYEGIAIKKDVY